MVLAREAADLAIVLDRLDATGRIAEALEAASDLVRMWARVGISAGVRAKYDRLLAAAESEASGVAAPIVARGLVGAAILAIGGSAVEPARERVGPWLERATALAREGRDDEALLFALEWAAVSIIVTGDAAWAVAANAEGLALAARLDDGVALTRFEYRAGMFAGLTGDLASVVAFGSSALRRARAMDDPESFVRTAQYLRLGPARDAGPARRPAHARGDR